ncbi:hypothetical protein K438DRAFT_1931265 [Mycena galopus ATCC 62051]|nr:hypothetical protein K438DRAFT_1931265 [Mycena galopus ATCC 62051]
MFALRFSRALCVSRHVHGRRLLSDVLFPVPPKSKGWPTPWITETEATDYLFPLYSQGWYIAAVSGALPTVKTAGLACRFTFPGCPPAAAFIKDVLTLTETENHHPCWLKLTNSGDNSLVHICTTTHSALRPEWDSTDTDESRALQGITLRDLRFAALVSSLPSNTFRPVADIGPSRTRPTWDLLCETLRFWATPASQTQVPTDEATSDPKIGPPFARHALAHILQVTVLPVIPFPPRHALFVVGRIGASTAPPENRHSNPLRNLARIAAVLIGKPIVVLLRHRRIFWTT